MSHPVYSIAVIMERRALANRWQAQTWEAIGIIPDPGDAATPRVLLQDNARAQWLHGGFELELHRDEAENYYLNLSAPQPCVFITWRIDRKSTRLNSSHANISHAAVCLKEPRGAGVRPY